MQDTKYKIQDTKYKYSILHIHQAEPHAMFPCFLIRKFISVVRFVDLEDIEKYV